MKIWGPLAPNGSFQKTEVLYVPPKHYNPLTGIVLATSFVRYQKSNCGTLAWTRINTPYDGLDMGLYELCRILTKELLGFI